MQNLKTDPSKLLLPLGTVVATPGALALLERARVPVHGHDGLLSRHARGDWGAFSVGDARMNDEAALSGAQILSSYGVGDEGDRIWTVTEADRSATTVLLPDEY